MSVLSYLCDGRDEAECHRLREERRRELREQNRRRALEERHAQLR